jgi:succinate dehydrogenase / fumarate reductase flavoprotein subunit
VSGDYQSKLTLMSESLRNDGRIWVPKRKEDCKKPPADIPEADRDYYLERMYGAFGNLAPRDIASRAAKYMCDEGRGIGETGLGVYLDFSAAIQRLGEDKIRERYGNLFAMYHEITDESAYQTPMRIYPAVHYTMGGLWVDYNLMSNVPGLFVLGEANFSDHGANRLGASALMQGLADGYFVLPATIATYLAGVKPDKRPTTESAAFTQAEENVRGLTKRFLESKGKRTPASFHKQLGKLMWDHCGMARTKAGLEQGIQLIRALREEYRAGVNVLGADTEWNQSLEQAGRIADFIELGELMCRDALMREESCGGHFREEFQYTKDDKEVQDGLVNPGDVKRRDDAFAFVAAWEFAGEGKEPVLNKEPLIYEEVKMSTRSYK